MPDLEDTAEIPTRDCRQCGEPFIPGSNRALYCGDACRRTTRRARTPKFDDSKVVGSRREGFRVVIDGVEMRWRPKYRTENSGRLPYLDRRTDPTEDLAGLATFEGSRHGGGIRAVSLRDDKARQWAKEHRKVDIGAGL